MLYGSRSLKALAPWEAPGDKWIWRHGVGVVENGVMDSRGGVMNWWSKSLALALMLVLLLMLTVH